MIPRVVGTPFSQRVSLRYVEHVSPTVTAGSNISYTYQSSAYDPYYAAGGHQPLYYDQWAGIYTRYRVYGYTWKVEASSYVETAGYPSLSLYGYSTVSPTPDTSNATTGERRDAKYSLLTMAQRSKTLSGKVSVAKWYGASQLAVKIDDGYSADTSNNPEKLVFTHFQLYNLSATAAIANLHITITYDVEFFLPRMVSGS